MTKYVPTNRNLNGIKIYSQANRTVILFFHSAAVSLLNHPVYIYLGIMRYFNKNLKSDQFFFNICLRIYDKAKIYNNSHIFNRFIVVINYFNKLISFLFSRSLKVIKAKYLSTSQIYSLFWNLFFIKFKLWKNYKIV